MSCSQDFDQIALGLLVQSHRLTSNTRVRGGEHRSIVSLSILSNLAESGPMRIGQLAECERLTQPAISASIRKLAAEDLVCRAHDSEDARATRVRITEKGFEALTRFRSRAANAMHEPLATLKESELNTLAEAVAILRKINQIDAD